MVVLHWEPEPVANALPQDVRGSDLGGGRHGATFKTTWPLTSTSDTPILSGEAVRRWRGRGLSQD